MFLSFKFGNNVGNVAWFYEDVISGVMELLIYRLIRKPDRNGVCTPYFCAAFD